MTGPLDIVHEDVHLLVVNKPPGLVCHGAGPDRGSLIDQVRRHPGGGAGRLVNRLDRETSGLVVVAKDVASARALGSLLAAGAMDKTYLAIVHGELSADLVIDEPIGPAPESAVAIRDRVRADGAPARTGVRPIRCFDRPDGTFTLVEVRPHTGRKHQIRIHLAHAGFPIVGDKIYGPDETIYLRFVTRAMTPDDERRLLLPHHALHASRLAFTWQGRARTFAAEPFPAFRGFAGI